MQVGGDDAGFGGELKKNYSSAPGANVVRRRYVLTFSRPGRGCHQIACEPQVWTTHQPGQRRRGLASATNTNIALVVACVGLVFFGQCC
jgi:hypothetical protein